MTGNGLEMWPNREKLLVFKARSEIAFHSINANQFDLREYKTLAADARGALNSSSVGV